MGQLIFSTLRASRITVVYQKSFFISSHRSELYGRTEFLANCGGVVGLFIGLSILSFVEIVYFLTIRICFKLRSRQRRLSIVPEDDTCITTIQQLGPVKADPHQE